MCCCFGLPASSVSGRLSPDIQQPPRVGGGGGLHLDQVVTGSVEDVIRYALGVFGEVVSV